MSTTESRKYPENDFRNSRWRNVDNDSADVTSACRAGRSRPASDLPLDSFEPKTMISRALANRHLASVVGIIVS